VTHVEGFSGTLESVDNVERSDSLALGVLSVGDRVSDDVYNEGESETKSRSLGLIGNRKQSMRAKPPSQKTLLSRKQSLLSFDEAMRGRRRRAERPSRKRSSSVALV